jgi:hypothetical protein
MSKAKTCFESSIKDAEHLLGHFDAINTRPPPEHAEVLKRAGLVMALTAWETYVEDRVREEFELRLRVIEGSHVGNFIAARLEEDLKRLHNPTAEKTRRLFLDYLGVDVTANWTWNQMDPPQARKTLDALLSKRGDAVHRSKPPTNGVPAPHLVKRDDLDKAIRFLKSLVEATDATLDG